MNYSQFKSAVKDVTDIVHANDSYFLAFKSNIQVRWDRAGQYADVYLDDDLLHDGCDIKQAIRYLKTQ